MCPYIPQGEPRKLWVKYEDESYEPVNEDENIHNKKLKSDKPDWFVVTEKPDWRPKTYANTKRGRQGKKELGTRQQMGQQAPTQNAFAWNDEKPSGPTSKTMEVKPNVGSTQPNTGGFTGRMKPEDKTIMGWTLGEVTDWTKRKEQEDAEAAQKRNGLLGNNMVGKNSPAYPPFGQQPRTQRLAKQAQTPKQQPSQPKQPAPLHPQDENDIQPQYRLTGHAVAYEDEDRPRKLAGADRATGQRKPGKIEGADNNAKAPLSRADFSGLFDTGKRGGVDRTVEPPGPAPEGIYNSKEFYQWRAEDFKRRNPGKDAPGYYMNYGDKYARKFSEETRRKLSPKGKKWVDQTLFQLQKKIEERMASGEMNELDPETFEKIAFEMHSDAYREGGINDLSLMDIGTIASTPEPRELLNSDSWVEGIQVAGPYIGNFAVEKGKQGIECVQGISKRLERLARTKIKR